MTTNLCLIGAGRIGRIHGINIARHPGARLRYVVDANAGAAAALAGEAGAEVADAETALADARVDAVVIASSTDTHLDFIEAAAAAGKPVFCEKPLDLDIGNARRAVDTAARAGIPLYVGFNRRYDRSFRRIHDELRAGALGAIEVVSITSRDPAPPPLDYVKRSGGLFRDMTIHDFDMARWLLGEEPVSVYATGRALIEPAIGDAGDIDTAAVILETARGAVCQVTNSRRASYGYDQRVEVFGAAGLLRADNHTATRVQRASAAGFLGEPALPFFLERYADAYRRQLDDFVGAVAGKPDTLADGADGLAALRLAEAAEASRRGGSAVAVEAG